MPDLAATTDLFKLFADPTRVRLVSVLGGEELTVAELTRVTGLVQSRVSTHLGRLREAGVLRVRRSGTSTFYALDEGAMPDDVRRLWSALGQTIDDATLRDDRRRVRDVIRARSGTWADSVAGQMERHYSPGRTWEAAAYALVGLGRFGDVLDVASGDGALAELVAPRARSVTCLDISPRVIEAGRSRLGHLQSVQLHVGDMAALPFADASFDHVMLVNALSYASDPLAVVTEGARALRPGGDLVAVTLARHEHATVAETYNQVQLGFEPDDLQRLVESVGLEVSFCQVTSRERRMPHFQVITLYARRPDGSAPSGAARPSDRRDARRAQSRPTRRRATRKRNPS